MQSGQRPLSSTKAWVEPEIEPHIENVGDPLLLGGVIDKAAEEVRHGGILPRVRALCRERSEDALCRSSSV